VVGEIDNATAGGGVSVTTAEVLIEELDVDVAVTVTS
jgi:hypothetical protein